MPGEEFDSQEFDSQAGVDGQPGKLVSRNTSRVQNRRVQRFFATFFKMVRHFSKSYDIFQNGATFFRKSGHDIFENDSKIQNF